MIRLESYELSYFCKFSVISESQMSNIDNFLTEKFLKERIHQIPKPAEYYRYIEIFFRFVFLHRAGDLLGLLILVFLSMRKGFKKIISLCFSRKGWSCF